MYVIFSTTSVGEYFISMVEGLDKAKAIAKGLNEDIARMGGTGIVSYKKVK